MKINMNDLLNIFSIKFDNLLSLESITYEYEQLDINNDFLASDIPCQYIKDDEILFCNIMIQITSDLIILNVEPEFDINIDIYLPLQNNIKLKLTDSDFQDTDIFGQINNIISSKCDSYFSMNINEFIKLYNQHYTK